MYFSTGAVEVERFGFMMIMIMLYLGWARGTDLHLVRRQADDLPEVVVGGWPKIEGDVRYIVSNWYSSSSN